METTGRRQTTAATTKTTHSRDAGLVAVIVAFQALVLHLMGRVTICKCGYVKLWHSVVKSDQNSQHLSDWYSFTHIIHGFILYWTLGKIAPRLPVGARFVLAVALEALWEVLENSPTIINRYRAETISYDYYGDSIVNSVADVVFCMVGFALARKLPVVATVALAAVIEIGLAYYIRDGLTLNLIMLIWPLAAIKQWQAAAGSI